MSGRLNDNLRKAPMRQCLACPKSKVTNCKCRMEAQKRIALTAAVLVARLLGTRDIEVVMDSVTGLVVMVSGTGSHGRFGAGFRH